MREDGTLRLGLCYVRGLHQAEGERVVAERLQMPIATVADFQLRTGLSKPAQRALAKIGALNGLADHQRDTQWKIEVVRQQGDLFAQAEQANTTLPLAPMDRRERTEADYAARD